MAVDLLRVFEAKALAEELTAAGHSVSERTVQRWKAGQTKPKPQDVRAIRELLQLKVVDTTKTPPPGWAEAMESRIVSEVRANREALYARLADEAAVNALRRAGLLPDELTDETQGRRPESEGPSQGPTT